MSMCGVQKCTCKNFEYPKATMIWRVINVIDDNTVEIWDGRSREKWGAASGTITLTIPEHGLVKHDEVALSVHLINRRTS